MTSAADAGLTGLTLAAARDGLRRDRAGLHSRKLRAFDEPPFR